MTNTGSHPAITSTGEQASGWKDSVVEIRSELDQGNIDAAVAALSSAMIKHGEQIWMLVTGHDVYRTAGQDYTALLYAEKLITLYPSEYHGYCRTVQTLTKLQRHDEALEITKQALQLFPREFWVLVNAVDVYRQIGNHEAALSCSRALIESDPNHPCGYIRVVQELLTVRQLPEAKAVIDEALGRFPGDMGVLMLGHDLYSFLDQQEDSLPHAQQLIKRFPSKWQGYTRLVDDLVALKRFNEALTTIELGLQHASTEPSLLRLKDYVGQYLMIAPATHSLAGMSTTVLSMRDMIAYSHIPSFFTDLQSVRRHAFEASQPVTDGPAAEKNFLFVTGLGRSGTSALGKLLNCSERIEVYTELYDPARLNGYESSDFSQARLQAALQRHPFASDCTIFDRKHAISSWIGDKRPNFHFCLESTFDNLAKTQVVRTVFIQRDLRDVLRSSHHRSENRDDQFWRREHGMEYTVLLHNATVRLLLDLHQRRPEIYESIFFVGYHDVFANPACSLQIFDWLDVELTEAELAQHSLFLGGSAPYANRPQRQDELAMQIEMIIDRYLDKDAQQQLSAITGLPALC